MFGVFWQITSGSPLTYSEIMAFSVTAQERLEPWEVKTLIEMDRALKGVLSERTAKSAKGD